MASARISLMEGALHPSIFGHHGNTAVSLAIPEADMKALVVDNHIFRLVFIMFNQHPRQFAHKFAAAMFIRGRFSDAHNLCSCILRRVCSIRILIARDPTKNLMDQFFRYFWHSPFDIGGSPRLFGLRACVWCPWFSTSVECWA